MPRTRYDLDDPTNSELADLCEAMDDATQKTVLRRAFAEYKARMLEQNPSIRARYDDLRRARRERSGATLKLVGPSEETNEH